MGYLIGIGVVLFAIIVWWLYAWVRLRLQFSKPEGGFQAFYDYIDRHLRYPSDARQKGIEGKVFVSFIVGIDGKLSNIAVSKSVYPSLDREAVRLIKESPIQWQPTYRNGKPTEQEIRIAIAFRLNQK